MYKGTSTLYFNAPFFWCSLFFQKYLNPHVTTNKMVNSVLYHPCSSRLASRIHLSYFFKLLRATSLQNTCWIFSDLYISPCGKKIKFMVFPFWENALIPHSKPQAENFLKIFFLQQKKGWRKQWFALSKFNWKIWRWLWTLGFLYFFWFALFLNMTALQFWK